jgi:hypothetical protein
MIPNCPAKTAASGAIAKRPPKKIAARTTVSGCRDFGRLVKMIEVSKTIDPITIQSRNRDTTTTSNERVSEPT